MHKTLAEIAKIVEGEVVGDAKLVITGVAGIKEAQEGDLTFVANPKYFSLLKETKASVILAPRGLKAPGKSLILTDNPSLAFAKVVSFLSGDHDIRFSGVHPTAVIAPDAVLGRNAAIGAHTVIESKAAIGDDAIIFSGCYIGPESRVGCQCRIYPNAVVREKVILGNRVIIHAGAVIGSDGFGFITGEGVHHKIPQTGIVIIEDDVEIGANVTIDRARFDKTIVGRGTKIDNLVHVAHNVVIGENCLIIAQVGISGSVRIEKNAILAGQAGIAGHLTIGEGAIVAAQAGVTKSVRPGTTVMGFPAKEEEAAKKVNAYLQRLPKYIELLNRLQEKVRKLEAKRKKKQQ